MKESVTYQAIIEEERRRERRRERRGKGGRRGPKRNGFCSSSEPMPGALQMRQRGGVRGSLIARTEALIQRVKMCELEELLAKPPARRNGASVGKEAADNALIPLTHGNKRRAGPRHRSGVRPRPLSKEIISRRARLIPSSL